MALGVSALLGGSDNAGEDNQRVATVRMGTLSKEVTIDGSIAFSSKKTLTFASQGFVDELLVSEGEEVKAGQPLAKLDPESVARLQQAVAQARLDLLDAQDALANAQNPTLARAEAEKSVSDAKLSLRDAQRKLDSLLTPNPHDLASAEKAVADARSALRDAWAEFDALLNPPPYAVAQAEQAVADARVALQDAQSSLGGGLDDARTDVDAAMKDLDAARLNLSDTKGNARLSEQSKAVDDKAKAYADAVAKWSGAELTQEELALAPDDLFAGWNFDPGAVYAKNYDLFPDGALRDNPATRWNELTVYLWTVQHPGGGQIKVTCEESDGARANGFGEGVKELCVMGDVNRAWKALDDARRALGRAADATRQRGGPGRGGRDTR